MPTPAARPASHRMPRLGSEEGQAVIEFALVLPILLLLIFGAFDLSRAYSFANDVNQIAGEQARAAAVGREPDALGQGTTLDLNDDDAATLEVEICLPEGSTGEAGDAVRAIATADVSSAILDLVGDGQVTGTAEMRLELPADYAGCPST